MTNAAHRQGMTQDSRVTALADGALNCWSVISVLQPLCQSIECILDWFHIGKKFQNVKNALGDTFEASLEKAKWKLWHGQADQALSRIELLRSNVTDTKKQSQLKSLYDYLNRNRAYLVNYEEREKANKSYTSQVAESHIETVINARHKKKGKMQWSREGAHNVLQIRATMAGNQWDNRWQETVLRSMDVAA